MENRSISLPLIDAGCPFTQRVCQLTDLPFPGGDNTGNFEMTVCCII